MLDKLPNKNVKKDLQNRQSLIPNLEKIKRKTIFALLSLVSTIGINGININNSAIAGQISLSNLQNNQINPNLIAQNNDPKWVIQGRQNIMKFVEKIKENGVIQSHLGENVLEPGQFVRLIINFDPNSMDAKNEIKAAIKDIISKMNESERRLVIVGYNNGKVNGLVITKTGRNITTGITNTNVERLDQAFPGLANSINNFTGQAF